MFHKPKGVVVTRKDEHGRRTVYDCLPNWVLQDGWVPIGRLDRDSRGMLLFTQDGEIVDRLTRPHACAKTYLLWVRGRVTNQHIAMMKAGVMAQGELLKAIEIQLLGGAGPKSRIQIVLDEGKNRHLRRMFSQLKDPLRGTSLKVVDLKRIAIGSVKLDIPSGDWRFLTSAEIDSLTR
ncbi:MAG: pseudouridine synthase [candidate division KSB1 bacterium]|nr:pseudouridine synthase [candidate division KSB1 bacterium]